MKKKIGLQKQLKLFDMKENFKARLKTLPDLPGIYLMKDALDDIIYVGKAKSLKKRVKQYFAPGAKHGLKVQNMVDNISDFEYIVVNSEVESLILESNLIKQYKTKYNILLRDDKQYPYIKITKEKFPRLIKTRELHSDGGTYFGPFPGALQVNIAIETLHELFPIRKCKYMAKNQRPCMNYEIGLCSAPCANMISVDEYSNYINRILDIIDGKDKEFLETLSSKMTEFSNTMNFEMAGVYRDKIESFKTLWIKQTADQATTNAAESNIDVIGIARIDDVACIQVFFVRLGKIIGRDVFFLDNISEHKDSQIIISFMEQFYTGQILIPPQILTSEDLNDEDILNYLSEIRGSKVSVIKPQKGDKKNLLNLANKNAIEALNKRGRGKSRIEEIALENINKLKIILDLDDIPVRIEAYDISHISGIDAVGSMVVYYNGIELRSDYRRFRIKDNAGGDDYRSLQQVIQRRFKRALKIDPIKKPDNSFDKFPDLLLIDGGKNQVKIVEDFIFDFGLFIPVCGMVKDERHNTRALIYMGNEIDISNKRDLFIWISKVQSEVHRYSIDYHRNVRSKRTISSILDDIPGIGSSRKISLLKHFGDMSSILKANEDELSCVDGIGKKLAIEIRKYLDDYQKSNLVM
ncbi:MAG: excinuclease ABC subunit UvrC [Tissierellia bacterium]|nr:excinuclease ABC subunit UvrC [Tissierellia bacterium]